MVIYMFNRRLIVSYAWVFNSNTYLSKLMKISQKFHFVHSEILTLRLFYCKVTDLIQFTSVFKNFNIDVLKCDKKHLGYVQTLRNNTLQQVFIFSVFCPKKINYLSHLFFIISHIVPSSTTCIHMVLHAGHVIFICRVKRSY